MRSPSDDLSPSRANRGIHHPSISTAFTSDGISGASRRLRALAALSGSLTDALNPQEAADLVEQKALSALGATSAVVVTLGVFPTLVSYRAATGSEARTDELLHVVHAIGLPAEVNAALDQLPLDAPVPFAEVARIGDPLFLATDAGNAALSGLGQGDDRGGSTCGRDRPSVGKW